MTKINPVWQTHADVTTHALRAKPLKTKSPAIVGEPPPPPGVDNLKVALPKRRLKRASPQKELIQTVLRAQVSDCRERFPSPEEMTNREFQEKGRAALKQDPRTADCEWKKVLKSFMRAIDREKLK
jgi:hypothetical protein